MGLAADKKTKERKLSFAEVVNGKQVFKGLSAFQAAIFCSKNSFFTVTPFAWFIG